MHARSRPNARRLADAIADAIGAGACRPCATSSRVFSPSPRRRAKRTPLISARVRSTCRKTKRVRRSSPRSRLTQQARHRARRGGFVRCIRRGLSRLHVEPLQRLTAVVVRRPWPRLFAGASSGKRLTPFATERYLSETRGPRIGSENSAAIDLNASLLARGQQRKMTRTSCSCASTHGGNAAVGIALFAGCSTQGQVGAETMEQATAPLTCTSKAECDAWWGRAQVWVTNHSDYKLQTVTDSIIQTAGPSGGKRVARLPDHQDTEQRRHRDDRLRRALRQHARLRAESVESRRGFQAVRARRGVAASRCGSGERRERLAARHARRASEGTGESNGAADAASARSPAGAVGAGLTPQYIVRYRCGLRFAALNKTARQVHPTELWIAQVRSMPHRGSCALASASSSTPARPARRTQSTRCGRNHWSPSCTPAP